MTRSRLSVFVVDNETNDLLSGNLVTSPEVTVVVMSFRQTCNHIRVVLEGLKAGGQAGDGRLVILNVDEEKIQEYNGTAP